MACDLSQPNQSLDLTVVDNAELQQLTNDDQAIRQGDFSQYTATDWQKMWVGDSLRRVRVSQMLDSGLINTAQDYWNAALIYQHGSDTLDSKLAIQLMKSSIALDSTRDKWLLAAAIDRDLLRRNKPQIYGTQYRRNKSTGIWEWQPMDPSIISDEERIEYNVGTLEDKRLRMVMKNKKKLSGFFDQGGQIAELKSWTDRSKIEENEYNISELSLIKFGYSLMRNEQLDDALKVFKFSTILYPDAFNTFDSYGECLLKLGREKEGIAAYKKSLALNPGNTHASEVLANY